MNLANILSIIRIILIPLMIYFFAFDLNKTNMIATLIFIISSLTDFFDGYIARKYNQVTVFGEIIDPIADKLLVSVALILIVHKFEMIYFTLCSIILISRELTISGLREYAAQHAHGFKISVSSLGKIKTTIQMISITMMFLLSNQSNQLMWSFTYILLFISVLISLLSLIDYLKKMTYCLTFVPEKQ